MSAARALRILPAGLLGAGTALLVACGSSGKGLIPVAAAGPLQSDFQAVLAAAQEGNGNCGATEAAIRKTERDLQALPSSVDAGLRGRLAEGVANLSVRARSLCAQPLAQTTTTTTPTTTTPTTSTTTTTPSATTEGQTTSPETPPTTGTPENEEGATRAPGAENNGNGVGNGRARHETEAGGPGSGGEEAELEAGGPTGGTGSNR